MSTSQEKIEIIPTCVPHSDFELQASIRAIRSFAPALHIDVSDGIFTQSPSWPYATKGIVGEFDTSVLNDVIFDAHLMVSDPRELGDSFARAGARSIVGHIESFAGNDALARDTLRSWKTQGAREVGVALLLDTDPEKLRTVVPCCDLIQIMSVATIGAQGASYDARAVDRVMAIRRLYPTVRIVVDGGVSRTTIAPLVQAGARRLAVGSALTKAVNRSLEYAQLKTLAESALQ
jgi:ribulose-phosphate 3-epimerase